MCAGSWPLKKNQPPPTSHQVEQTPSLHVDTNHQATMKLSIPLVTFLSLATTTSAVSLTGANWDAETKGKIIFVKFQAPWCGNCQAMKSDWEILMDTFEVNSDQLIVDVDCTDKDAEALCEAQGIEGYPTIRYGPVDDLMEYEGTRDYDALLAFAKENLKPICSLSNFELCDEEKKAEILKLQALSNIDLHALIHNAEQQILRAQDEFEVHSIRLQNDYNQYHLELMTTLDAIKKESGIVLMKKIAAKNNKAEADAANDEL